MKSRLIVALMTTIGCSISPSEPTSDGHSAEVVHRDASSPPHDGGDTDSATIDTTVPWWDPFPAGNLPPHHPQRPLVPTEIRFGSWWCIRVPEDRSWLCEHDWEVVDGRGGMRRRTFVVR